MRQFSIFLLLSTFAFHLHAAGTTRPGLAWSKAFGGQSSDYGTAVATDSAGNVYVAGNTTSPDFPVNHGFQPHLGGAPLRTSTDFGNTWSAPAIGDSVYSVAGSAKAPGVLYAGTGSTIYKSTDGGKTWTILQSAPQALVNALIVDSGNPAVVYAGTTGGIFKSQDSGATWTEVDTKQWYILDLVANPTQPATIFAGILAFPEVDDSGAPIPQTTVYRSSDSGATWSALAGLPDLVIALTCDPTNPNVLYATANPGGFAFGDPSQTSIYKTTDGGNTWKKLIAAPVTNSTFALAVSSTAVFAATLNGVTRSLDGGATWAATTITALADNLAIDPVNPQTVYASSSGIWVSADGGATWKSSLPVRQNVQTLAAPAGNPGAVFVGATPGQNIFVMKWTGDGKQMLYSTYLGGSYYDVATGIAVDGQGNAYVTGYTYATDFPVTAGVLQPKTTAVYTGFIAKISPDGGTLLSSTYLGGSSGDAPFAIALDSTGSPYLTGYAGSSDFPITPGAFQSAIKTKCTAKTANLADGDAFVTKLSSDLSKLGYSTFLGGSCGEQGLGIAVDSAGNVAVVGTTESSDFPVTKGAYLGQAPNADSGFIAKLSPQGSSLVAASYIGDVGITTADGVAIDANGAVYISGCGKGGTTPSISIASSGPSLPSPGLSDPCFGAPYVLKLDPSVASKIYLNYTGTRAGEGSHVAVDPAGRVWTSGFELPFDPPGFPDVHPFQIGTGQGFVSEWSADGTTLLFSSQIDSAYGMALDGAGNAFITGFTNPAAKQGSPSALLARIDASVASTVTVEAPQRITPGPSTFAAPDQSVAAGEILVIQGTGLGPAQTLNAQVGQDGTIASTLAGTTVTFDGVRAPLLSVQAGQIVCVVPFEVVPFSVTTMQVQANGAVSNSIAMPAGFSAVEAFGIANQNGTANTAAHPAAQGSVVTVYAAGYGWTVPRGVDGVINGTGGVALDFGLSFGVGVYDCSQQNCPLVPATILYAGPAPGQVAGVMQINFRLPALAPGQSTVAVGFGPQADQGNYDIITVNVGH